QTSWQGAQILGLALGGWLLARADLGGQAEIEDVLVVLGYDGATFLASALALFFIVVPRPRAPRPPRIGFLAEVREGARTAWRDPVV
ncbi:MAG: hypothetical protein ACC662_10155, partial [Planctomycetota bacterium]